MTSIFIFLVIGWVGLIIIALSRYNLRLKRETVRLAKEIEIQNSKLNYQKKQSLDSANYFFSAVVTIMEMMGEINSALKSEERDLPDKIMQIIFEKARDLLKPEKCILFKIDARGNTCSRLYSFGYGDKELKNLNFSLDPNNSFLGWSAATGRFFSIDDAAQDPLLSHLVSGDPLRCYYSQPLKVDNEVKAVLCTGQLSQNIEKDTVIRAFSILSNIASVALSNALLTQELRQLSVRDSLTGLYNHSYFHKWLDIPLDAQGKKEGVLSIAMVDLDNFKTVNDVCGHQAGDIILKGISELLNNLQTDNYICARYGGEEFVLGFIGKGVNQILPIIDHVRKEIAQRSFAGQDKPISITISAGLVEARFSENKKTITKRELIGAADSALYRAKAQGKNRVEVAQLKEE